MVRAVRAALQDESAHCTCVRCVQAVAADQLQNVLDDVEVQLLHRLTDAEFYSVVNSTRQLRIALNLIEMRSPSLLRH